MSDNILSYLEMCNREGLSLQRGMNFGVGGNHSVILMSVRPNAPYRDRIEDGGTTLIYEGHDHPKGSACQSPKSVNQPGYHVNGKPTQNGKFYEAAVLYKNGERAAERVRVYEKIREGIWTYNGMFLLVDSWLERDEQRSVYKFKMIAVEGNEDLSVPIRLDVERRRVIPTHVKLEVWKRDGGKCSKCGATDELHFDHILPFSKGGTSLSAENVQLLCARHNLQKRDKIE